MQALRDKLNLNPLVLQYPIGSEQTFEGVIDLIEMTAHYFAGENGEQRLILPIPLNLREPAQEAREKLLDRLSMFSDGIMEKLLEGEAVPQALMWETIRKATLSLQLTPVLMGSAFKNKGVQNLLDAIALYLPSPNEREVVQAIDSQTQESVTVDCHPDNPLLALAFKITEEDTGQLTYTRLYSGTLRQGDTVKNSRTGKRVRIGRLVRMHANYRQEITEATAGDIIALIGVDCASGNTLCDLGSNLCLEGIIVPEPVVSLSIIPKYQDDVARMSKALHRFTREDPTFRVTVDPESNQTLISGMGELHLAIYIERMKREYKAEVDVGTPAVAYRETISQAASFDYKLKKQAGGAGQYAHVMGRIEPCSEPFAFENQVVGGAIPQEFISACEKGFREATANGVLMGYPVTGVKVILQGGSYHRVDSKELAFRYAAVQGFLQGLAMAKPMILEPIMRVDVETPNQYLGRVQGDLCARRGLLLGSQTMEGYSVIQAEVPLKEMFGYSTAVRSLCSGQASFTMELATYRPVPTTQ